MNKAKLALVTGASRGLGAAIATELAAQGYQLLLTGRDERALTALCAKLPDAAYAVCELRDPKQVQALAAQLGRRRLDLLVNNAGMAGPAAPIAELDFDAWREVLDTNLHGTFLVTQAVLPRMKKGSVIVNNVSIAARTAFPNMAAYNVSKRGLLALTDTLREELRPRGIRVLALLPGAADTAIWKQFWPDAPRRKMISPQTIARMVAAAVAAPAEASVDELVITPSAGAL